VSLNLQHSRCFRTRNFTQSATIIQFWRYDFTRQYHYYPKHQKSTIVNR